LVEADYFRDRSARAASPMLRAENNEMVTFYERRWRSFGGGR